MTTDFIGLLSVSGDDPLIKLHAQVTVSPAELPLALAAVVKAVAQLKGEAVPAGLEAVKPCPTSESIARSLLEPALRTADMNEFEVRFAGYLDQRAALHWWHRNVAKSQLGLQGWRRHRVYPDFVFGLQGEGEARRIVLMETKGLHLAGSADTVYKQALLERLTRAFRDERLMRAGELELVGGATTRVSCDLVFDAAWTGSLQERYFAAVEP